ncbi:G protein [Mundri virus]|uniref:G protein n=1 Tax=Mundri virus TaxID=2913478 RepID=UPI002481E1F1|nr:G protein [Mundri virus]UJY53554.1 G protein [Mundri virus]
MVFLIVLFVFSITQTTPGLVVNLPLGCKGGDHAHVSSLKCPPPEAKPLLDGKTKVHSGELCRPQINDKDIESGYLCHKDIYVSKCSETWYFSAKTTHSIEHAPIQDYECVGALARLKLGIVPEPEFPVVDCYWNADTVEKREFIILTEHDPQLDPYSYKLLDNVVAANCDHNICQTNFINTLWIRDLNTTHQERCDLKNWDCHHFDIYQGWKTSSVLKGLYQHETQHLYTGLIVESHILGHVELGELCQKKFCNQPGYVFPDSSWWSFSNMSLAGPAFSEHRYNPKSEDCEKITSYGFSDADENLEYLTTLDSAIIKHEMCLDTLALIGDGYQASVRDLERFVPDKPGPGPAYYLNDTHYNDGMKFDSPTEILETQCMYYLVDIHNLTSNGTCTLHHTHPVGTLLHNNRSVTLEDLGLIFNQKIRVSVDPYVSIPTKNIVSNKERDYTSEVRWYKPEKANGDFLIGPNGITILCPSEQDCKIHFPSFSKGVDRIPHFWTEKHSFVKYRHVVQRRLFRDYEADILSKNNPYDFNSWIGRHVNRTEIPAEVKHWFSKVGTSVFDSIWKVGSWLKVSFYICILAVFFKIAVVAWNRFQKLRKNRPIGHHSKGSKNEQLKLDVFGQSA